MRMTWRAARHIFDMNDFDASSQPRMPRTLIGLNGLVFIALAISGIHPHDRITWLMEISPLVVVLPLLWLSWKRFPLTTVLYVGIAIQCVGLVAGAAYTFPRVPLGAWIADLFDLSRNPYDRIGHFVQGFVPALAARELLVRKTHLRSRNLLPFLTVCIVMTFSASYEIVEWIVAVTAGSNAEDFLGMQGDIWDAQADMACAFVGAVCMLVTFAGFHDRQIARLDGVGTRSRSDQPDTGHRLRAR
jgi:putative membrane protein